MIGNALKARQSTAITLVIDPENPYGVYGGQATRWITREKNCVMIGSMGNGHIINTINMLERGRERRRQEAEDSWSFAAGCRGDMASYYAGHMVDDAENESFVYEMVVAPILAGLRAEAKRRGLSEVLIAHRGVW